MTICPVGVGLSGYELVSMRIYQRQRLFFELMQLSASRREGERHLVGEGQAGGSVYEL